MEYHVLVHPATMQKAGDYLSAITDGMQPGSLLKRSLVGTSLNEMSSSKFLEILIRTKHPRIYAESEVAGDGSDWNQKELSILGDVGIHVPVTVYDNGIHQNPDIHETPFKANLLFTPGALLRNDTGNTPADWNEVTSNNKIDPEGYYNLYERRLLPHLLHASETSMKRNTKAFITIPGLGCGLFAGPFKGHLGSELKQVLIRLLQQHGQKLSGIHAIYYDPHRECENERLLINDIHLLVRPLTKGNQNKPQLCKPEEYEEENDNFTKCKLWSFVAWDHVSWPGNDFYGGSRMTDDGVKAAATDSMFLMTGIEGYYNEQTHTYDPPKEYENWRDVILKKSIQILVKDNLFVISTSTELRG